MAVLSREAIIKSDDRQKEVVSVPEWGGDVIVRAMSSEELDSWEQWAVDQRQRWGDNICPNLRASLCVRCIVDEKGERVFGDGEVEILGRKSGAALDRIYAVAARLSGRTKQDFDELKKA
jgi:hypothetical protein